MRVSLDLCMGLRIKSLQDNDAFHKNVPTKTIIESNFFYQRWQHVDQVHGRIQRDKDVSGYSTLRHQILLKQLHITLLCVALIHHRDMDHYGFQIPPIILHGFGHHGANRDRLIE